MEDKLEDSESDMTTMWIPRILLLELNERKKFPKEPPYQVISRLLLEKQDKKLE